MTQPYILSIETSEGHSFKHGYHLGTDLEIAKTIAAERYEGRVKVGLPTITVAVMLSDRIVDVYYGNGEWHND